MKNSIKNLSKKISSFSKKAVNSFKSTFKKYPKTLGFLSLLVFLIPMVSLAGEISDAIYVGFLQVILTITNILKTLASIIIYSAGVLFDNMLVISLSTDMYDADWIKLGWGYIRDIANIAFILGIVIIGFFMIVGRSQWKKMLTNLIIISFIMNFSMFFGRVIIDAGNFTAAIFYSMSAVNEGDIKIGEQVENAASTTSFDLLDDRLIFAKAVLGKTNASGEIDKDWKPYFGNRSIATGLVAFVNPTGMYTTSGFEKKLKAQDKSRTDADIRVTLIILNIVFILTMVFMASAFIMAAFMFISRTIHLIKWIIAAPIYFAWYFLPGGAGKLYEWFGEIANKAFCITSYMVGMWLIFLFLSNDVSSLIDTVGHSGVIALVSLVVVKSFLIYKALGILTDMGVKTCNDGARTGEGLANFVGAATGFVGGGFLKNQVRSVVGVTGRSLRESGAERTRLSNTVAGKWVGRMQLRAGNKLYDDVKIGGQTFKSESDRSTKENSEMRSMWTKEQREEEYWKEMGGKEDRSKLNPIGWIRGRKRKNGIEYEDGVKFRGNDEKENRKEVVADVKKIKTVVKNTNEKRREDKVQEMLGKDSSMSGQNKASEWLKMQERKDRVEEKVAVKNYIENNLQPQTKKDAIAKAMTNVDKVKNIKHDWKSTLANIMAGTVENQEARRQDIGKLAVKAKLDRETKEHTDGQKISQANFNEARSKINLEKDNSKKEMDIAKKELASSGRVEGLLKKQVRLWDTDRDGSLDLKKYFNTDKDGEVGEIKSGDKVLQSLVEELKSEKSSYKEIFAKIEKSDVNDYQEAMRAKKGFEEGLTTSETALRLALRNGTSDEIESARNNVKANKEALDTYKSDPAILKVTRAFESMATQKVSHINDKADTEHTTSKEEYESKKKKAEREIDKLKTELKEVQDNIASGIHTHNPTRENTTGVTTLND